MLIPTSCTLWLFDYDLTLYGSEEHGVLDALDRNITDFVSQRLGVLPECANKLRQEYWQKYGTTLGGLQALHGVSPQEFFDFIHSAEGLRMPMSDPRKKALLDSLPGHSFVFTNARRDWAERGIEAMGIANCFAGLFDLEFCGWMGKPDEAPYRMVEDGLRAQGYVWERPGDLVLLDDKPENLLTARRRGWSTVLVHPQAESMAGDFDGRITHLLHLPEIICH